MSEQRYRGRPLPLQGRESPYASDRPQPLRVKPQLTRHPADVPVRMAGETESDPPLALEDDQPRQTLFPNGSVLATMTYVWDPVQEMPVPWDGRTGSGGGGGGGGIVDQGLPTTNARAWPVKVVGPVDQGAAGSQAWPVSLSGQPISVTAAQGTPAADAAPWPVKVIGGGGGSVSGPVDQGSPNTDANAWPVKVVSGGGGGGGGTVDQGAAGSTPWPVTIPTPVPVSGTVGVTQPVQVAPTSGQPLIVAATSPLSVTFPSAQAVTIPTPVPVSGTVGVSGNIPVVPVAGSPLSVTFPTAQAVTVGNFPTTQSISGSVVAAQGAAGADTVPWPVKLIPATQPISGTVSVSNLPTTQPVSGMVSVAQPVQVSPTAGSPLSVTFPSAQPVSIVSGGGGGGAVTIADGADITQGAKADLPPSTGGTGVANQSVSAISLLKGLYLLLTGQGLLQVQQGPAAADTAPWPVKLTSPTNQPVNFAGAPQPVNFANAPQPVNFAGAAQPVTVTNTPPTQIARLNYTPRAVAAVAAGNNNTITPPAGYKIWVYKLFLVVSPGTIMAFVDDGGSSFSGNMTFTNFTTITLDHVGADPLFITATNASFIIYLAGTAPQAVGTIWYVVGT